LCCTKVANHVGDRLPDRQSLGHATNFGDAALLGHAARNQKVGKAEKSE
jgi:hypothetical protein